MRSTVRRERQSFLQTLVNNTGAPATSHKVLSVQLAEYEKSIQEAARSGLLLDSNNEFPVETDKWSIVQAIFFCSTVITSIGYGSLVPVTFNGRIFCMFYALIGELTSDTRGLRFPREVSCSPNSMAMIAFR